MNKKQDWFSQMREKNAKIKQKPSNKELTRTITDLYQISKPGSKKIEWVCRERKE